MILDYKSSVKSVAICKIRVCKIRCNPLNPRTGQSLIEFIIAATVFAVIISSFAFAAFAVFDLQGEGGSFTAASRIAREGIEAAREIREQSWENLANGDHGVLLSGGVWQFEGLSDFSGGKFTRVVSVRDISPPDPNIKEVQSRITWDFRGKSQDTTFLTRFTNWNPVGVALSYTGKDCGEFLTPGKAEGPPDLQYIAGDWRDARNEHSFSNFSDSGISGSIIKVEAVFIGYTDRLLTDDRAHLDVLTDPNKKCEKAQRTTATFRASHTITSADLNTLYVANPANITSPDQLPRLVIDITQDVDWQNPSDIQTVLLDLTLDQIRSRDGAVVRLDAVGLRVMFR